MTTEPPQSSSDLDDVDDLDALHKEAVAGLRLFAACVAVAGAAGGLYVAWLGWNTPKFETSPGNFEGPYLWWKVLGLFASVAVVVAVGAAVVVDRIPAIAATVVLYVLAAVDEATRPGYSDPSLGQVFLVAGAVGLGAVLCTLTSLVVGVRTGRQAE